ncbi:replicative DNA helicase [Oenococcus kitaharae]|uniref:replicative DNA helicase n=1 Tax=Oenococcus TaxID=46254 RepID=UPI000487BBE6|nr:replicative DNA helicase [Oenococcus kitaharae]MCV3296199.1 replicative DNA helicase [Oenococcus kitaharae]
MADSLMDNRIPQEIQTEKALLSAFFYTNGLSQQQDVLDRMLGIISEDDFYDPKNKKVFQAINELLSDDKIVEPLTVSDQMKTDKSLDMVGGEGFISEILLADGTIANVENYAKAVHEKATQRRLIDLFNQGNGLAHDPSSQSQDLIANVRAKLDSIEDQSENTDFIELKNSLSKTIDNLNNSAKNNSILREGALPSGYAYLDKLTKGWQPNNLIILAARPAVGKTAFALNLAINAAKSKEIGKKTVVVFNMEMDDQSLSTRILAANARVPMDKLMTGKDLTQSTNGQVDPNADWTRIMLANERLSRLNIHLDTTPGIRINEIRAKLRNLQSQSQREDPEGGIGLVIIDYLQLIESDVTESRQQAVAAISRSLKKLAGELDLPIIALSQLSRGVEGRTTKRPMLSDLRDSGAIEQDADIVMFLYRDDYYDQNGHSEDDEDFDESAIPDRGPVELIVSKNRQGANDTVKLMFDRSIQFYGNLDPHNS